MIDINSVHTKKKIAGKTRYEKICVYCGKEVAYFHGNKPKECPHCGSDNYIKPPTETTLFLLQKKYLETKDKKYLSNIFKIVKRYSYSIIKKHLPRDFHYHYDKLDEKSEDVATIFIENYLNHNKFYIEHSFGGYLTHKVKEVLWNKKDQREENHESLNKHLNLEESLDSHHKEIMDVVSLMEVNPLYGDQEYEEEQSEQNKKDLVEGISVLIYNIITELRTIYTTKRVIDILIGVCLKIEGKSSLYMDKFYHYFGSDLQEDIEKAMLLIYRFIKERD